MTTSTTAHILAAIQRLDYNFREFTLGHFIDHLVQKRGRDIILRAYPFDKELHGLWIRAETADYVFYNQTSHEVHKVHNILHELGHIILNHTCYSLATILPAGLLSRLSRPDSVRVYGQFRLVEPTYGIEEYEAEAFVRHLQREIIFANRMDQLTRRSSSIEELRKFTRSLGYHD